jgi:hypothetical protein
MGPNTLQELVKDKPEDLAEKATRDSSLLSGIFDLVSSTDSKLKFKSAKILVLISKKDPGKLYPKMGFFINLLDSENSILKWNAIGVIANLALVDVDKRFDKIFGKFYGFLQEGSLITAGHVVGNSGKIANAKPDLESKITNELLKVEKIRLPTEECRNILLGHAILSFDQYFDRIQNKDEVISFVRRQLKNSRNATRAKAERFLKKHSRL